MLIRLAVFALAALVATRAGASGGISVPEPSNSWLFALGVAGLLVGRYAARRKPPE